MVTVLISSAVDRGFDPRSGQTKYYNIGICCFSDKHSALRRKNKDWLARNQDNVYEWSDKTVVSVDEHNTNPTKRVGLVQSGHHHHIAEKLLSWW